MAHFTNNNNTDSSNDLSFRSMHMMHDAPSLHSVPDTNFHAKTEKSLVAVQQQTADAGHPYSRRQQRKPSDIALRRWKHHDLTVMPVFYVVSPLHRYLPKSDLSIVLDRLVKVFQFLSLQTTFHDTPSIAARCISLDQVELEVSLWACRKNTDNFVLEVQRIDGDSMQFGTLARDIVAAATGETAERTSTRTCFSFDVNVHLDSFLRRLPVEERYDDDAASALDFCSNLMRCDRRDARTLALQTLTILVDTRKTMRPVAESMAKAILLGYLETEEGLVTSIEPRIQNQIMSLALKGCWTDTPVDDPQMLAYDKSDSLLALTAMAHAASLLKTQLDVESLLQTAERSLKDDGMSLVQLMQSRIGNCEAEPHEAYLATRIVTSLCRAHPDLVKSVEPDCIRTAQIVGHMSHAALETESSRLLVALQVDA